MSDKIPLQALKNTNGVSALSEFNSNDTIPIIHGGTGKYSIAANKILYSSSDNVFSESEITAITRTLLSKSSIEDINAYLGLIIGTNSGQLITASSDGTLPLLDARNLKNTLPAGIITFWQGSISSIPQNFVLCDGSNGTPDLRDKFIVGAGSAYSVGAAGGSTTHTHTVTVQNTTLTVSQMPIHQHGTPTSDEYGSNANGWTTTGNSVRSDSVGGTVSGAPLTQAAGGGLPHNHGATTTTVSNLPPYYALAYIMSVLI